MRLPRHDTLLSLPALDPGDGVPGDEELLSGVSDTPLQRWWIASSPAIVVGLALHHRLDAVLDVDRCRAEGVAVIQRRAGGGAVWLDEHVLCGAICLPLSDVPSDVTESYRWVGECLASALGGRRVSVEEARADLNPLRDACFGALSPHEVVDADGRKFVGLAQVRRRHAALFQVGVLCDGRDQSRLADFLRPPTGDGLRRRSAGVSLTPQQAFEAVAAVCSTDATPSAP
jgi:lipoate---protein ligase